MDQGLNPRSRYKILRFIYYILIYISMMNNKISVVVDEDESVSPFFNPKIVCLHFLWIAEETLDDLFVCHCLIPFYIDITKTLLFNRCP